MASCTLDRNTSAGGRGDLFDDAERYAFPLEDRPLLDVQFRESLVIACRQRDFANVSLHSSAAPDVFDRFAAVVLQLFGGIGGQSSGENPASEASDAEASGLFGSQN